MRKLLSVILALWEAPADTVQAEAVRADTAEDSAVQREVLLLCRLPDIAAEPEAVLQAEQEHMPDTEDEQRAEAEQESVLQAEPEQEPVPLSEPELRADIQLRDAREFFRQ